MEVEIGMEMKVEIGMDEDDGRHGDGMTDEKDGDGDEGLGGKRGSDVGGGIGDGDEARDGGQNTFSAESE